MPVPNFKSARGSGGMFLHEILKLESSEIVRNVYFSIYFCILTVFTEGIKLHEKEHFAQDFEKWGGMCPCAPQFLHP